MKNSQIHNPKSLQYLCLREINNQFKTTPIEQIKSKINSLNTPNLFKIQIFNLQSLKEGKHFTTNRGNNHLVNKNLIYENDIYSIYIKKNLLTSEEVKIIKKNYIQKKEGIKTIDYITKFLDHIHHLGINTYLLYKPGQHATLHKKQHLSLDYVSKIDFFQPELD